MKLGSIAYLQKPSFGCAKTFYDHIRRYHTTFPLLLYSFHEYPDAVRLRVDPECQELRDAQTEDKRPKPYAISNAAFFAGIRLARSNGFSHIIYLETDCRVGESDWDERMFSEFFNFGRPLIAAGTLAAYNTANAGISAARRWKELVTRSGKNVPVATYGWKGADISAPVYLFPNGALAIYDVEWVWRLFQSETPPNIEFGSVQLAAKIRPYDQEIGARLWDIFGENVYDVVGYLECIYSGFGDVLTTPEFRRELLRSGKIVAGHQYKDEWVP